MPNYRRVSYWFWAIREAAIRINLTPTVGPTGALTTPFELYYGMKPDGRVLFPCTGYYRFSTPTFQSKSLPGMAMLDRFG